MADQPCNHNYMLLGNDISQFQSVAWPLFKDNANFVIMKATEGTGFTDPQFTANQAQARSVGLPLGYYHFARPDLGNSATDEVNYFLGQIGTLQEGEILALDYEVTYNDPVTWCKSFLDEVYSRCQIRPLIYLNQATASGFDWTPVINGGYGLWIAAYTYDPNKNDFNGGKWQTSVMQQWTDQQQVPGISGNVDGDVFFGDVTAFKAYGYHVPPPPPPPDPCAELKQQVIDLQRQITELNNKPSSTVTVQIPVENQTPTTSATTASSTNSPSNPPNLDASNNPGSANFDNWFTRLFKSIFGGWH